MSFPEITEQQRFKSISSLFVNVVHIVWNSAETLKVHSALPFICVPLINTKNHGLAIEHVNTFFSNRSTIAMCLLKADQLSFEVLEQTTDHWLALR